MPETLIIPYLMDTRYTFMCSSSCHGCTTWVLACRYGGFESQGTQRSVEEGQQAVEVTLKAGTPHVVEVAVQQVPANVSWNFVSEKDQVSQQQLCSTWEHREVA